MRSRFLKYLNKQCEHLGIHKIETETNLPVPVNLTLYRVPPKKPGKLSNATLVSYNLGGGGKKLKLR